MKVRALRGVCAGVGKNLKAGDIANLDPGTTSFLVNIKAVEIVEEKPAAEPSSPAPAKAEPAAEKTVPKDVDKGDAKSASKGDAKPQKSSRKPTK